MEKKVQKSAKKSTSERLSEILPKLSKDQLRFVIAILEHQTKREAAESIGVKPNTAYKWDGMVDEAAELIALERVHGAREMNRMVVPKAMAVKIAALDSENEVVRQKAATELIEWVQGKAKETHEHKGDVIVTMVEVVKDYGGEE